MSDYEEYPINRYKPSLIKRFRNGLRRWLMDDNYPVLTAASPPQASHKGDPGSPFLGDFHGWQFRMHRAVGGHIVEAWRHPKNSHRNIGDETERDLFIISSNEEIATELPHIMTQLALRG